MKIVRLGKSPRQKSVGISVLQVENPTKNDLETSRVALPPETYRDADRWDVAVFGNDDPLDVLAISHTWHPQTNCSLPFQNVLRESRVTGKSQVLRSFRVSFSQHSSTFPIVSGCYRGLSTSVSQTGHSEFKSMGPPDSQSEEQPDSNLA